MDQLVHLLDSLKLPFEVPILMHPISVHFAIAIPVIVMLIEIVNLFIKRKCLGVISSLLLLLAVGIYIGAFFTGKADGSETAALLSPDGKELLKQHKMLGIYLVYAMGALFILRLIVAAFQGILSKLFFIIVLAIFMGFMFKQGKMGGELVYTYGANVKAVSQMDDKVMELEDKLEECKSKLEQSSTPSQQPAQTSSSEEVSSSSTQSSESSSESSQESEAQSSSSSAALIQKAQEALEQIKGAASSAAAAVEGNISQ